jgi:Uma2 family endonuclease
MPWQEQSVHDTEAAKAVVPPSQRMTEEQFVQWCDEDTRAEWVDGEVIMMSPVNYEHADLQTWLAAVLRMYVEHRDLGTLVGPEFQARLPERPSRRVPDILFVSKAREDLIERTQLRGAPDLCIEIVSPDSVARDWREKYLEYEAAGVKEYWVIDPASEHVEVYVLAEQKDGPAKYRRVAEQEGAIVSSVLTGLRLPVEWLWPGTRPKLLEAIEKLGLVG